MLLDSVRRMLGWDAPPAVKPMARAAAAASFVAEVALPEDDDPVWPTARIAVAESVWGPGYLFPGGDAEIVRYITPMGLSEATSLLLVGAGCGGPQRAVTSAFGVWVGGYEANPRLLKLANDRIRRSGGGKRSQIEAWDPNAPNFRANYYHHALALEALRSGNAEPMLLAIANAMKPGGHLVLIETVADHPLDPRDALTAAWAKLADRPTALPGELAITKVLTSLGFDVRIVEDISRRHMSSVLHGWLAAVQAMEHDPPPMRRAALLVREAELWLLRLKLMQTGKLRLVRWHSIGG